MGKNLLNKYIWFVETIHNAKRITYEEINTKWRNNELSDGLDLPLRTFHKWRNAVEEMFGLIIDCERKGGYHYYIANAEELKEGNIRNRLINTFSISNLLVDNLQLNERILLEEIPSGQKYFAQIIGAMKNNNVINMTYQSYWRDNSNNFDVEPYSVKLFRQRWYLLGRSPYKNKMMIYALDRIQELWVTDAKFELPASFNANEFFSEYFGVNIGDDIDAETVKLKVASYQANYIRAVPLHHSQEEIERTENFSIFELRLRPTNDLIREILWHGEAVEVLAPMEFRSEVASAIEKMRGRYK
ncbi:MAG: WYL domain-containing protein [Muribaculaceae bacterium]|nr:WYL domain-containing protein [Muribaculaceae bacterium]